MTKFYRLTLLAGIGFIGISLSAGVAENAYAFHDGGVAGCEGCHTMHNSANGNTNANGGSVGVGVSSYLTKGSDPSSTCLNCHKGDGGGSTDIHVFTSNGTGYNAGGDFYWLTVDVPTESGVSLKDDHGHNVIAADYGLTQDSNLTQAPHRGSIAAYQAAWLGCNSCHDPHGKKDNNSNQAPISGSGSYGNSITVTGTVLGNYRLLGGYGYDGGQQAAASFSFTYGDPVAIGLPLGTQETNQDHVDYGSGMSEWCSNCHVGFTADGAGAHRHPAGGFADMFAANYNSYKATGDITGQAATAFEHLVPFERGVYDSQNDGVPDNMGTGAANLLGTTNTYGMGNMSIVMCLTCHRAHSTPFANMGRWDFNATFLLTAEANAETAGYTLQQLYGGDDMTRFNQYQRSLCNKCHNQDN